MFLEEIPAVLSLGKLCELCEDHGYTYHWTSGSKPHLIRKWQENWLQCIELCTIRGFSASSSSTTQLHFHQLLHHLHHRSPCLMSTDTPKIQYQKVVEVRVESFVETRCMKPQKPKTKINMGNQKKYTERYRMNCLNSFRNSEKEFGWWKYSNKALEKPRARKSRHFQVISWISIGASSKRGTGFG